MFAKLSRTLLLGALSAAVLAPVVASAQSIPPAQVSRELVRRVLLDACVYAEAGKEDVKKEKVVDACQCASHKALKGVKEEEIAKIAENRNVPDAWYSATTDAYEGCRR
ncbi:MAG: hypothetical protein ABTQ29_07305 [Siculibacillus sp.]